MQSLSKSNLPLKITKIFMVFVLFFSLMIQKPKETHAFPLALLLPAVTNPATVTAVLGVLGLGAVGVASGDWYNENYQKLEQTAIATAGQMSTDMYNNLQTSINNLQNGFTSSLDLSSNLLTDLMGLFKNTYTDLFGSSASLADLTPQVIFNGNSTLYQFNSPIKATINGVTTTHSNFTVEVSYLNGTTTFININGQIHRLTVTDPWLLPGKYSEYKSSFSQVITWLATIVPFAMSFEYGGVLYNPSIDNSTNLELDNVGDYVTNTLLSNQNKLGLNLGINDLVGLKTNQGVPLYVDNVGQVVLRDGRVYDGDLENIVVSHRVPAVTDVAGTLTPTLETDFGRIDVKTGEIVIPNPNPPTPNPTPNVKPESTKPPTGIQRFLPAAVVIVFILFLKAIVFYAIRLFDFILTLPLTPSKPINNYAFQWFMDAKILGIQVYDTVLAFAMFAFSLTIYKVIRRIW